MKSFKSVFLYVSMLAILAGCQDSVESLIPKEKRPLPEKLVKSMKAKGMTAYSPIMARIFKKESALEIWKRNDTGRFQLLKTYDICRWSGKLGPKLKEGDRQAPEGFYTVTPGQMNPKSSYYLSFNMGFPNTFDRSHDRTGTHLMIHGACSSAGCYSMTDKQVAEIYSFARDSFKGGQKKFQIQAFPFRMTPENMVRHEDNENYEFWKMLKKGHDYFEVAKVPPKVDVCEKKYVFNRQVEEGTRFRTRSTCPQSTISQNLEQAYLKKSAADNLEMVEIRARMEKERQLAQAKSKKKRQLAQLKEENKKRLGRLIGKENSLGITEKVGPPLAQPIASKTDQTVQAANIPQPRPLRPGEEPPVVRKKSRGLFSWLWGS